MASRSPAGTQTGRPGTRGSQNWVRLMKNAGQSVSESIFAPLKKSSGQAGRYTMPWIWLAAVALRSTAPQLIIIFTVARFQASRNLTTLHKLVNSVIHYFQNRRQSPMLCSSWLVFTCVSRIWSKYGKCFYFLNNVRAGLRSEKLLVKRERRRTERECV